MNSTKDLNNLYLETKNQESEKFLFIFYFIGPILYLGFWFADFVKYYQLRYEFLIVRLGFCVLVFLTFIYNKRNKTFFKNQIWQLINTIYASAGITYMMMRSDGPTSIYFSGLNLVAILSLMFATYRTSFFTIALIFTYLPYIVLCLANFDAIGPADFITNCIFILGTIMAIIFARDKKEKELIALLKTQLALNEVVTTRDRIIVQKSNEAIKLNQLSSQFSPQVVQAIKEGKINLQEGVSRTKICAIFIDIVNSTEKIVKLDSQKVEVVLARFLDTTLTIFLKYDLTIDKFHGDGVLAFSNNPIERADYIERVCLAAIEVKSAIAADNLFYTNNWGGNLEVRIGISSGEANVGFYGNKKYFRSFTAIGAPLAFASRLTSIALPSQILIDSDIAQLLIDQNYVVTQLGERNLKGFSDKINIIYCLDNSPTSKIDNSIALACSKHPDSVLYLDTNEQGQFIFKCRECEYDKSNVEAVFRESHKKVV